MEALERERKLPCIVQASENVSDEIPHYQNQVMHRRSAGLTTTRENGE